MTPRAFLPSEHVECPRCHAPAGARCGYPSGATHRGSHRARVMLALVGPRSAEAAARIEALLDESNEAAAARRRAEEAEGRCKVLKRELHTERLETARLRRMLYARQAALVEAAEQQRQQQHIVDAAKRLVDEIGGR